MSYYDIVKPDICLLRLQSRVKLASEYIGITYDLICIWCLFCRLSLGKHCNVEPSSDLQYECSVWWISIVFVITTNALSWCYLRAPKKIRITSHDKLKTPFAHKSINPVKIDNPARFEFFFIKLMFCSVTIVWYYMHRMQHVAERIQDEDSDRYA